MKQSVLILGGTGAMGVYLRETLVALGYSVIVTSRSKRNPENGIRWIQCDAHSIDFIKSALSDIHPDAVVDFMCYTADEFANRRDILLSYTGHYLFLSTYRVFNDDSPITERSPRLLDSVNDSEYLKTDEYALDKARQENILRQSSYKKWTILRPSITYSKERFQFGCLEADVVCLRALQGLPVIMPREMLSRKTTLTWGKDVAKLISRLILNESAYTEDYNVVTSESHSWQEVADIYSKAIGLRVQEVSMSTYCKICNPYQVKYDRMFNRVLDNQKVLNATGLTQNDFTPLAVGLAQELSYFKANPHYKPYWHLINAPIDRLLKTSIDISTLRWQDKFMYYRERYPAFGMISNILLSPKYLIQSLLK